MYSCTLTFQTLLGSFVQRTSQNPLSFPSAPFPVFCECKGTTFSFPSNTFINFFLFFFHFPSSTLKDNALQRAKQAGKRQFGGLSAKKTLFKGTYRDKKHRKISQIRTFCGKTERDWLAYRTRITPGNAEKNTGNGKKAGMPHPRPARTARDRTDDNGPFARRGAKQRKEKAHLIKLIYRRKL